MRSFLTPQPLNVDAYQAGHFEMIPEGMSDFECSQGVYRKPLYPEDHRVVAAGMAPFIQLELEEPITQKDIDEADWFYNDFNAPAKPYPWPKAMFQKIVNEYNGYMPIVVSALPDGEAHYIGEPHVQVWTDEKGMGELVGWIESTMLPYLWVGSTVATRGRIRKEKMAEVFSKCYPSKSKDEINGMIAYKFHDFGRRGAANSQISGIAHLINWLGTDTMDAAYAATTFLNGRQKFGACSIAAAAHRSITPWEFEKDAYQRMIDLHKGSFFSVVADSYNYTNGMKMLASYGDVVKSAGGFLVGRPDSGDPVQCIIEGLEILSTGFGISGYNEIGGRILNSCGIIQGDGVSDEKIFNEIYPAIINAGWCVSNVAFGMGEHNHKAVRSELEAGYKTCLVGKKDGTFKSVMKGSESLFKRSIPCPVAVDCEMNAGNARVYPISPDDLKNGYTGDLKTYYDGRNKGSYHLKEWSEMFFKTRERAFSSWDKLVKIPQDTFFPKIREMQEIYMKEKKG